MGDAQQEPSFSPSMSTPSLFIAVTGSENKGRRMAKKFQVGGPISVMSMSKNKGETGRQP
jgi:hypothetical protein